MLGPLWCEKFSRRKPVKPVLCAHFLCTFLNMFFVILFLLLFWAYALSKEIILAQASPLASLAWARKRLAIRFANSHNCNYRNETFPRNICRYGWLCSRTDMYQSSVCFFRQPRSSAKTLIQRTTQLRAGRRRKKRRKKEKEFKVGRYHSYAFSQYDGLHVDMSPLPISSICT